MSTDFSFAHLSDIHMRPEGMLYNTMDGYERASRVVDAALTVETPLAFMLITGDNIDEIEPAASYARLKQLLARVKIPTAFALGNHDVRREFRIAFEHELGSFLAIPGISDYPCHGKTFVGTKRILVLDTLVPKFTHGYLDDGQLQWLATELDQHHDGPTILALHHCPLPIPTRRFAKYQLTNADALERVVLNSRVKPIAMLFGHIHYSHIGLFGGIPCVSAPGIAMGIAPDALQGLRLTDAAGFNLCHVIDGRFVVNPVITQAESRTVKYDMEMSWQ